jgi:hypothetical protein
MGNREHGISADVAWIQGETALLLGGGILWPPLREKQISLPVMGNIEIRVDGQRAPEVRRLGEYRLRDRQRCARTISAS